MTANMIASVIVTILSCVIALVLVLFIASLVLQKLKKEVFRYIKVYNKHLKEGTFSEEEIAQKKEPVYEEKEKEKLPADPAIPFIAKSEPMQKTDFFSDYLAIRSAFCQSAAKALQKIPEQPKEEKEYALCVSRIAEKLTFEVVYQISCLPSEKQLSVLEEILTPEEKPVLVQYLEEDAMVFDIAAFCTFLKERSKAFDDTVHVYTRNPESLGIKANSEQLQLHEDANICEGFQIVQGNRLYDYGVRSSEITL